MRISIPEEVKKAQQVYSQKDRILAQAQEEVNRTLVLAREKADQLVEKEGLTQEAQKRAGQIFEQSRMEAENIKAGADQYAMDSLLNLEMELERVMNQVRNGIQVLEEKKAAASEQAAPKE